MGTVNDIRRIAEQEEPMPLPNGLPAVWDLVIADMKTRDTIGVNRYGMRLQPYNGRSALRDLYYELLDAAAYIRQKIFEEENEAQSNIQKG